MKMIKETISQKLLDILSGGVASTINIVWAMSAPKSVSRRRWGLLRDAPENSVGKQIVRDWKYSHDEYKRYHALLGKLEKQGLVETNKDNDWMITRAGASSLCVRKDKALKIEELAIPGRATVISYDIPERMRRERTRIRETLKLIGFEQVHQSVWLGNKKVSKHFLELLRERKIFDCIHIFEVNKTGTLKKLETHLISKTE